MRGIVTLAAALAFPLVTASGPSFPFRSESILISFAVILATLVVQGLSLPPLIRTPSLVENEGLEQEERLAREHAATVGLARLDALAGPTWSSRESVERLRLQYVRRLERLPHTGAPDPHESLDAADVFRRLRRETVTAERLALIALRNNGTISDEVLHRLEHERDVEALRHGFGERRAPQQATEAGPVPPLSTSRPQASRHHDPGCFVPVELCHCLGLERMLQR